MMRTRMNCPGVAGALLPALDKVTVNFETGGFTP